MKIFYFSELTLLVCGCSSWTIIYIATSKPLTSLTKVQEYAQTFIFMSIPLNALHQEKACWCIKCFL